MGTPEKDDLRLGDDTYQFRLYVAGRAQHSMSALANLTAMCEQCLPGRYQIETVDVLLEPLRALADEIFITPTLVKLSPPPICQLAGSLSDRAGVLLALHIKAPSHDEAYANGTRQTTWDLVRRLAETEALMQKVLVGEIDVVIDPVRATPILLRETQDALIAAEARYDRLIRRTAAVLFELAPDGTITFVNDAALATTGYGSQELLGANWWTQLFPGAYTLQADTLRQQLQTQDVTHYEIELMTKSGSAVILDLNTANYYSAIGALQKIVGLGIDVTERRLAQRELEHHRSHLEEMVALRTAELQHERVRLSDLIANLPGMVWETWSDPSPEALRVNFISQYIENMTGYTPEEWLSTPDFVSSVLHPEDRERSMRELSTIMASGIPGTTQARWLTKTGEIIWVETYELPILDANRQPVGMRGVTIDVTEQHLMTERLMQLYRLTAALSQAVTLDQVIQTVISTSFGWFGAHLVVLGLRSDDGRLLETFFPPGECFEQVARDYRHIPLESQVPMAYASRTGQAVWLHTLTEYQAHSLRLPRLLAC